MGRTEDLRRKLGLPSAKRNSHYVIGAPSKESPSGAALTPSSPVVRVQDLGSESTTASIRERNASSTGTTCALCGGVSNVGDVVRVPASEVKRAMQRGFDPFETPSINMDRPKHTLVEVASLQWKQRAATRTDDWILCPRCVYAYHQAPLREFRKLPDRRRSRSQSARRLGIQNSGGESIREGSLLLSPLFACLTDKIDFVGMDPIAFEETVKTLFECFGLTGTLTPSSGDHGIDIQLRTSEGSVLVVQCKRYLADQVVSPREVREFLGAITYARAVEGFFVSTSRFSRQCYEFAQSQPLYLIDRALLKELFDQAEAGYRSPSPDSSWREVRALIASRSASAQAVAPENSG